MGFASGSLSFRRFATVGNAPTSIDQAMIDKLAEHSFKPTEMGIPEEVEYGWSGGRHVLDDQFSFDLNVFAECLFFGMRVNTNKVPPDLKKAWIAMEEQAVAAGNPSGFISKAQKKDVKETIRQKVEDEMRGGKHLRSKVVPILWDIDKSTLYAAAAGSTFEMLAEIFERSFALTLIPLTAGAVALRLMEPIGRRRDYEDLRPTRFVPGPEGEGQYPEYPWVARGPEPKDFLGNEFLLWLWHEAEARDGEIKTADGTVVAVFIDRSLDLDCAYGQTGRDGIRGDGPGRTIEAIDGLRVGKVPRRAGMLLNFTKLDYSLVLNPEVMGCSSLKLPDVEDAETLRVLFEERIGLLRELTKAIDGLFAVFMTIRASSSWSGNVSVIQRWIQKSR